MCKPFHAGHAAASGILSARLATRGFKSRPDILDCTGGFAATYANQSRRPCLDRGPEYFSAREIIFKYHASCYGTHAPIEAALRLASRIKNCTNRVSKIVVKVETQYLSVCNIPEPSTPTEAQFSIRHAVAIALSGRDTSGLASFSVQAIQDAELTRLRRITTVIGSESIARANAELLVTMDDGATLVERVDASVPETNSLRQRVRLEAKFHTLLSPLVAVDRRDRIVESCRHLEAVNDLREMLLNCRIDRRTANSSGEQMRDAVTVERARAAS
jgi:2-methylcitrate dehydratase PrpD